MNHKVLVPLAEGFEEVEAITIIDLLRRAEIAVTTVSVSQDILVKGAHGIGVKADAKIQEVKDKTFEAVILPGGMPGTSNLAESPELGDLIQRHQNGGQYVAAICAAPTVLAKYGVLKGKRATSYPGFEPKLTHAKVVNAPVVEDGQVVTSQGPGTAIPFVLKMIEKLAGGSKAEEVRKAVLA